MKAIKETEAAASRYVQLAQIIRQTIDDGGLRDNEPLPSERDLAEQYEVSRDTVRKAVRYMEDRGIVYSGHGRGTFVAPAIVRNTTQHIDGFSQDVLRRGGKPGQKVLRVEQTAASMAQARLLNLQAGDPLTRVRRIRLIDGAIVGLHDAYFVLPRGALLAQEQVERTQSLYRLLIEEFGSSRADAVESISPALADRDDAKLLQVKEGSPLLVCERITLSDRREPIEYCLMKYVASYRYKARITKQSGGFS